MAGVYRPELVEGEARPIVNPYLERALDTYQCRRMKQYVIGLSISIVAVLIAIAWVLLANPEDGWLSKPVGYVGVPGLVGLFSCAGLAFAMRRLHILDKLRSGIAIRRVRRDITKIDVRKGLIHIERRIPTIFVDFTDGKTLSVMSLGDVPQLQRIEELLRKQQEQQPGAR